MIAVMSFDTIGERPSWRRSRVAGVANCGPIIAPAQPRRSSVPMPETHELANDWIRDQVQRLRQRPDDERVIRLHTGGLR
jgi:hypothetical protein